MLKNISSMNKKNDNELLEIPDFLKKLSTDEKDEVRPKIEQPDTTKITPLTEFKEEPSTYTMWLAELSHSASWGYSTSSYKMRQIKV